MAENKKSFVLYADLIKSIDHLSNEEKGILFTHLLQYVNDMNPVLNDRLLLTAWKPIELQLKRDLIKFEEVKQKRSEAGKRSAELRALKSDEQQLTNSTSVESVEHCLTNLTDNVNDNDNDNVNVNDINKQPKVVIDWNALLNQFNQLVGKNHKLITEKAKRQLLARLKDGYTKQDIWNAIQNCYNDEYHKETNHKYLTLEFISRPDKMERYSTDIVKKNKNKVNIEL